MIVVAVVRRGVTPLPDEIEGVIVPLCRIAVAPDEATPVEKLVSVPEPPVPAGASMLTEGESAPPDAALQAPVARLTCVRA